MASVATMLGQVTHSGSFQEVEERLKAEHEPTWFSGAQNLGEIIGLREMHYCCDWTYWSHSRRQHTLRIPEVELIRYFGKGGPRIGCIAGG